MGFVAFAGTIRTSARDKRSNNLAIFLFNSSPPIRPKERFRDVCEIESNTAGIGRLNLKPVGTITTIRYEARLVTPL